MFGTCKFCTSKCSIVTNECNQYVLCMFRKCKEALIASQNDYELALKWLEERAESDGRAKVIYTYIMLYVDCARFMDK